MASLRCKVGMLHAIMSLSSCGIQATLKHEPHFCLQSFRYFSNISNYINPFRYDNLKIGLLTAVADLERHAYFAGPIHSCTDHEYKGGGVALPGGPSVGK